jgi:hypothetical protein
LRGTFQQRFYVNATFDESVALCFGAVAGAVEKQGLSLPLFVAAAVCCCRDLLLLLGSSI